MKLNTRKGEILINTVAFNSDLRIEDFQKENIQKNMSFTLINESKYLVEFKYKEGNNLYNIVFEHGILSYITYENILNSTDWDSYEKTKEERINYVKNALNERNLNEHNNFDWGLVSYEFDPRNIKAYILIDFFNSQEAKKESRFLIDY